MLVDHERVLTRLKEEVQDKQGIGRDGLYALIARLEVECSVEEGLPERALRLYGVALSRDLITSGNLPAPLEAQAPLADGSGAALPRVGNDTKEADDGVRDAGEDRRSARRGEGQPQHAAVAAAVAV